jgi:hypothetical protein
LRDQLIRDQSIKAPFPSLLSNPEDFLDGDDSRQ